MCGSWGVAAAISATVPGLCPAAHADGTLAPGSSTATDQEPAGSHQVLLSPSNNISLYNHQLCWDLSKQQNSWRQCFHILQEKEAGETGIRDKNIFKAKWLFKKKGYKKCIPVMKFGMHLCCQGHELEKRCKLCYKMIVEIFFFKPPKPQWGFSHSPAKPSFMNPTSGVSCYAVTKAVGILKGFACHTTRIQWIIWGMFCSCQISVSLWHSTK